MNSSVAAPEGDRRIVARGLTRRFGERVALHPIAFEISPGGVTGLLGPNGSGKSTLMRLLLGLVRPDAGAAVIDGVELRGDGTAVRQRCTFAPGEIAMYTELRASSHLAWLLRGRDADALPRATKIAEQLGLPLRSRVRTYSHGMKRQLLFAAALAPRVGVRILDEPSEGLDPSKRGELLEMLAEEARAGTTVLLSSHHLGEVDRVCEKLLFLNQGRLIRIEDAEAVRTRAMRVVHLHYGAEIDGEAFRVELSRALTRLGAINVVLRGRRAAVEIASDDPRAFLAKFGAELGLPRPEAIEYGQLSLQELYAELYGVEGV
jgi:ABC-2 type transport system ATP-binding protein